MEEVKPEHRAKDVLELFEGKKKYASKACTLVILCSNDAEKTKYWRKVKEIILTN